MTQPQHRATLWLVRPVDVGWSGCECLTRTWRLQRRCTRVLGEVDFRVCSYYYKMKYLQGIKPFQMIAALVDRTTKRKEEVTEEENTEEEVGYADAEQFMIQLRTSVADHYARQNATKRKIGIFQRIEVQPHFLEETDPKKMVEFEFHLGSDSFLERTEALYEQLAEIGEVVLQLLDGSSDAVREYFQGLEDSHKRLEELLALLARARIGLKKIKEQKEYTILGLVKKKRLLKEKLHLLKSVKGKNEAAFMEITNIDQAFATEQSRAKLYRKLTHLTELERSKYALIVKNKLIATARANKVLVEQGLLKWASGTLNNKQIEKLAFLIYFIQKEEVYRDNAIKLNFSYVDTSQLRAEILKLFQWGEFHYIKDKSTRQRIYEFLDYLLKRVG